MNTLGIIVALYVAQAPTTPSGAIEYKPAVKWLKASQSAKGSLILSLWQSQLSVHPAEPIWLESRLTNQSKKIVRIPKFSYYGSYLTHSHFILSKDGKAQPAEGKFGFPPGQSVSNMWVTEDQFFSIKPGQTIVIETNAITGTSGPYTDKSDYMARKMYSLSKGEYAVNYTMAIGSNSWEAINSTPTKSQITKLVSGYQWKGASKRWFLEVPKGTWTTIARIRVIEK